jgi:hypothetical protein
MPLSIRNAGGRAMADYVDVKISESAAGDRTLRAGTPGKSLLVLNYTVIGAGAVNVTFKSGTTAKPGPLMVEGAGKGVSANAGGTGLWQCGAGEDMVLNLDASIQVGGHARCLLV